MSSLAYAHPPPPFSAPRVPREFVNINPCPETLPVLKEVFEVLRHDWIRNFLFTSDPVQVTVLTSLAAAHAVNVIFRESSVGRSFSSTATFPVAVDGETVLVPAFSTERFSTGVGVKRRTSDIPKDVQLMPWTGQLTSEHLRYVADTETGSYFVVRHSRMLPYVFIEVFTLKSPIHRQRTVLTFHVAKLHRLVERYDFESFPYVAHTALAMVQVIKESRECNVCGSALDPSCRCLRTIHKPQHPMDFAAMKRNLASHFGAFQGFEVLNLYTAGAQIASAELGARFSVSMNPDLMRTRDLIYWAVNDRIVSECPGLQRQLNPVCNDGPNLIGYFGDLDDLDEEDDVMAKKAFKPSLQKPNLREVARRVRSSSPTEEGFDVLDLSTGSSRGDDSTPDLSTPSQNDDAEGVSVRQRDPEKVAKMQIRREKNREAARRSNLTKKLKTEELKNQMAETTARMEHLQAKEAELRLENSRLRKMASGAKG